MNRMCIVYFLWMYNAEKHIPHMYITNMTTWIKHNKGMSFHIVHKNEFDSIIRSTRYSSVYNNYQKDIQRCDFARYFLLATRGGVYLDMDMVYKRPLSMLKSAYPEGKVFLAIETVLTDEQSEEIQEFSIRGGVPEHKVRVANYFMMSKRKHAFWKYVFKLIHKRKNLKVQEQYDIIYTTGPDLITTAYHNYIADNPDDNTVILLSKEEADTYFEHQSIGSWKCGELES